MASMTTSLAATAAARSSSRFPTETRVSKRAGSVRRRRITEASLTASGRVPTTTRIRRGEVMR